MHSKATIFEFTSYKFEPENKRIFFNYKTEFGNGTSLFFTETIVLPEVPDLSNIHKELLKKLLEGLHLVVGISYYKFYCATEIKLKYSLSKKEADFWNIVYKKGLGEFFYKNKLDPKISPKFPYRNKYYPQPKSYKLKARSLVGIGGGKDSIVSFELLKQIKFDTTAFTIETNRGSKLVNKIIKTAGTKKLKIRRLLDPKISDNHLYNGHIPISAIYAFLGILSCVFYSYKYFIVSNEHSSNFGNLKYKGVEINHQWSKSLEFEKLFQDYVNSFISQDVSYFSLLRPFYEIRVARTFSELKKYFYYFSSCNRNFKINYRGKRLWCGNCPKCAFVFTLLSAFVSKNDLIKIFKKNLYQDENLLPLFKDILGFGEMKPFDCVGTFKESRVALYLAIKKHKDFIACPVVKALLSTTGVRQFMNRVKISKKDIIEVFSVQSQSNMPEQFKFLVLDSALILGYGREGKVTEKYLKKYYPGLKIGVADSKQGRSYLDKQHNFNIAVKTPGIKKGLVTIPYTTATNIFFSKVLGKNTIIGVTGSKGKSTTSSLIYEILKTDGKNVELLGNIGKPMLERLLSKVNKDTIFILELSSAQLDDIKFSPDIAVVTNLFPEHMDYHGNVENYYNAKRNIIKFQSQSNYFVYDSDNKKVGSWLKNYKGRPIIFSKNIPVPVRQIPLLGEHNKNNIMAAVAVAKLLNIKDEAIAKGIKNFKTLPNRLEFVGEYRGIKFYNDGSSTNPESAILAIKSIPGIDTILLGGEDRGYEFSELEKTIKKYKIRNVVLFPDSGKKIIKNKNGLNIFYTNKMKEAVKFAYKNTKRKSACLLSGGSPSYSLWENFEEKGNQFKRYVKSLGK